MRFWFITSTVFIWAGCRTVAPASADIKHVFGETTHDSSGVLTCSWDQKMSANPRTDRYLAAIAKHIADTNPKTFSGNFAIDNICIYVQPDKALNAQAARRLNTITINSGIITAAENDAEVAATLVHELAHLTMQSDHGEDVPPEVLASPNWPSMREEFEVQSEKARNKRAPFLQQSSTAQLKMLDIGKLLANQVSKATVENAQRLFQIHRQLTAIDTGKYIALQIPNLLFRSMPTSQIPADEAASVAIAFEKDRTELLATIRSQNTELAGEWEKNLKLYLESYEHIQAITAQLNQFQDKFDRFIVNLAGQDAKYNWQEQQADEVGYELYLRAGFEPKYMPWLEQQAMSSDQYVDCIQNHVDTGVTPARNKNSHPSHCWRIFDFLYLEAHFHAKDYNSFWPNAHTINLPQVSGELLLLKKLWNESAAL